VGFILLASLLYLYNIRKRKKIIKGIEKHLIESEKKVIDELKKSENNEIWQKQLLTKTEFSKAKLSRIIKNLEKRDLVRKVPIGNTNKVVLK
jgi:uncharacterized membrane protein